MLNHLSLRVWLSATDGVTEDVWLWLDGSEMTWTNWEPGEPAGGGGQNCLMRMDHIPGHYNDRTCGATDVHYFCENIIGTDVHTAHPNCKEGHGVTDMKVMDV